RRLDAAREEYQRRYGRDIERVTDLVKGTDPVLATLPTELHGSAWELVARYESRRGNHDAAEKAARLLCPGRPQGAAGENAGHAEGSPA
ncbi:MAG: hypothetical protein RQ748_12970, partial [Elusimicrobiales bacterium]|nr:hypothetical protein [Elusimicrobiales bacterium]